MTAGQRVARLLFPDRPAPGGLPTLAAGGGAWPVGGAQIAVVHRDRVVLQLRPWPPGWELPGGHCEPGEDPGRAATRELQEETGLEARVVGLVGVYTWEGLRAAGDALYVGRLSGGARRWSVEAWEVRSFPLDRLPRTLFPWEHQRIRDAAAWEPGAPPVHRVQPVTLRHVMGFATQWLRAPADALVAARRGGQSGRR